MFVQCALLYSELPGDFVFHNFGTVCHTRDIFLYQLMFSITALTIR